MKKNAKHIALLPLSLIYGIVTGIRNWLFGSEIIRSTSFNIPVISVGNLAAGGTGKTPHTEFILSLLQHEWRTAMLSRGYKRKTKGFHVADENSTSLTLGDEPYQIHQKFPAVTVAVDEKRVRGVENLLNTFPGLQAVVLDDAFQHRYIEPGLSILLTDYSNLYTRDLLLPAGTLRECHSGSKRANIIVVTKCPSDLKPMEMRLIEMELKPRTNQHLFFSTYVYDEITPVFPDAVAENRTLGKLKEQNADILLVTGIVSPEPIVSYLNDFSKNIETAFFPDHHAFQQKDFNLIKNRFDKLPAGEKILLVTEKDAARLQSSPNFPEELKPHTYALPIQVRMLHDDEQLFIQKIKHYVAENSRNR